MEAVSSFFRRLSWSLNCLSWSAKCPPCKTTSRSISLVSLAKASTALKISVFVCRMVSRIFSLLFCSSKIALAWFWSALSIRPFSLVWFWSVVSMRPISFLNSVLVIRAALKASRSAFVAGDWAEAFFCGIRRYYSTGIILALLVLTIPSSWAILDGVVSGARASNDFVRQRVVENHLFQLVVAVRPI